ncbi:ABC transporter ATP-binding protein [Cellulomonas endophytica]|uniref:ABC transporter ATP-binding protein n=1 Tax=Cellulomonas endophytica TaxID=2494735 RepID=UPI00101172BC|nr:ABC transporter ATP-binding protein [Cellulomonas endophytica]
MDAAVRVRGLVKDYGRTRALHGLDLDVRRGEVLGLLGPNGAGKSTTLRVLLDLLRPTAGSVEVLGRSPQEGGAALRARIGYLPGELALPPRVTAGRHLGHLAALRGDGTAARVPALAERFGLDLRRPLGTLSKGNRQKVGIVQAFAPAPELLVLDEPTSGLDPLLQRELRLLVGEARDAGATVLLSSHALDEVEEVAGRVAMVRAGLVVDVDAVGALRARAGQHVRLEFAAPVDRAAFAGLPGVEEVVVEGAVLTCLLRGTPDALLRAAAPRTVVRWSAQDRELEELFLDLYRGRATPAGTPPAAAVGGPPAGVRP